jgi:glycosidase
MSEKVIIYQVLTRLFGNKGRGRAYISKPNTPNGTLKENGVGKFENFTPAALRYIRELGATHVWYTGVIEHSTMTAYPEIGRAASPEGIVKGRAGSPYAIRDYYNVDPDLAVNSHKRMDEFEALVKRTHEAGLKMVIDFVPNHVARDYHSVSSPDNAHDLGADDWSDWGFRKDNNFYYCVNEEFRPQFDAKGYTEFPARVTGNDCFSASPTVNDWYETVKLNYGVDYCGGGVKHFEPIPDTWFKMRDILLFWASKNVDGFRCDMAEMVPVEFWHWAVKEVKSLYPELIFIAEVYNPALYRQYVYDGGFDYLYDKVGMYDTLRSVICRRPSADIITQSWQACNDIKKHMISFLENHDEQRVASRWFAGTPLAGRPAMAVAALLSSAPTMLYFGQELGEEADNAEGFSGDDGRTTIFDYWRIDKIERLVKGGFSDKKLTEDEISLLDFYRMLLNLPRRYEALRDGGMYDLTWLNVGGDTYNTERQFAWLRHKDGEVILCVANFDDTDADIKVNIGSHAFDSVGLSVDENALCEDVMTAEKHRVVLSPDSVIEMLVPAMNVNIWKLQ